MNRFSQLMNLMMRIPDMISVICLLRSSVIFIFFFQIRCEAFIQ